MWPLGFFLLLSLLILFLVFGTIWATVGNTYADRIDRLIADDDRMKGYKSSLRIDRVTGPFGNRGPIPMLFLCAFEVIDVATGQVALDKTRLLRFAWPQDLLHRVATQPRFVRDAFRLKCQAVRILLILEVGMWAVWLTTSIVALMLILSASG